MQSFEKNFENSFSKDINVEKQTDQPTDSVSWIEWMPTNENIFAISSWDGKVSIYQIQQINPRQQVLQLMQATKFEDSVIRIAWKSDGSVIFASCTDHKVYGIILQTNQIYEIGEHLALISGIQYDQTQNLLITVSYDKQLKFWQTQEGKKINAYCLLLENKALFSDLQQNILVIALSEEKICVINIHFVLNGGKPQYFDSLLNKQSDLTCIQLSKDMSQIAYGSIDGRVNLSSLKYDKLKNEFTLQTLMTFKCHKIESGQEIIMVSVNSIQFNPRFNNWVATSGGDGQMAFWDISMKQKIQGFNNSISIQNSVNRSKVSPNGQYIAYALGYDWHQGVWGLEQKLKSQIVVHQITEQELKYDQNQKRLNSYRQTNN